MPKGRPAYLCAAAMRRCAPATPSSACTTPRYSSVPAAPFPTKFNWLSASPHLSEPLIGIGILLGPVGLIFRIHVSDRAALALRQMREAQFACLTPAHSPSYKMPLCGGRRCCSFTTFFISTLSDWRRRDGDMPVNSRLVLSEFFTMACDHRHLRKEVRFRSRAARTARCGQDDRA